MVTRSAGAGPGTTWSRRGHSLAYHALTAVVAVTDQVPARYRFGRLRQLKRALWLGRALPRVTAPAGSSHRPRLASLPPDGPRVRCVLAVGSLGHGGVEAVVGLLATQLPTQGVECTVVCLSGGAMADELRGMGVTVVETGVQQLDEVLDTIAPDVVQVHNAPPEMIDALSRLRYPLVPVVHNIELYLDDAEWRTIAALSRRASVTIAVSDAVRRHHQEHVPGPADVVVIPNGAAPAVTRDAPDRASARAAVAASIDRDLGGDFLAVCLARYNDQKNLAGLVAGFLDAVPRAPALRLLIAGDPDDPMELWRCDALRRSHRHGGRVHLLGSSHAPTLLRAADVFVLNSFFEGWPVSATEAASLGVPLVMSDVGGARELVGGSQSLGVVVPNPAGTRLDERSVAAARRARRQLNRSSLVDALVTVASAGSTAADRRVDVRFTHEVMVQAHAALLRDVADGTREPPPG